MNAITRVIFEPLSRLLTSIEFGRKKYDKSTVLKSFSEESRLIQPIIIPGESYSMVEPLLASLLSLGYSPLFRRDQG